MAEGCAFANWTFGVGVELAVFAPSMLRRLLEVLTYCFLEIVSATARKRADVPFSPPGLRSQADP
jgi:hypothetical protein